MSCSSCFYLLPVASLLTLLYIWGRWKETHFSRHGIKSLQQKCLPVIETIVLLMMGKTDNVEPLVKVYKMFPNEKYIGMMHPKGPFLIIKDLELIKLLTIKDFDHFHDHINFVDTSSDPMFSNSLFGLRGQKWRDMRATLSPAFTSSKMRNMFSLVAECGQQMAHYFLQQLENKKQLNEEEIIEIEMKETFTRCTNDVIATSAFGIKLNSLADTDNEFYRMGAGIFKVADGSLIKLMILIFSPKLASYLGISLFSKKVSNFFRRIVFDTIKAREEQNIYRPDMIQLLMEAKKGTLKHETTASNEIGDAGFATVEESNYGKQYTQREWTDDELAAQAFLFFAAGFDSASLALSFMCHELAINPDVQEKLQKEIDDVLAKTGGKLDYNILRSMKYMDMVFSETMRMWPAAVQSDRECTKSYTLSPPNDSSDVTYQVNAGTGIMIPIYAIHHDPQYFPEPQRFDPERFSDDNKDNINPMSYMPFGVGPRNCIGSRFALMEVKSIIFHMLAKFDFVVIAKTQIPLKFKKGPVFSVAVERGFWVGLKRRNKPKENSI